MIWYDLKNLENKIAKHELSDKEGLNYVIAYFVLTAVTFSLITNDSNNWVKLSECVLSVLVNVWGLKAVYKINSEIDGKDFFKRFFAINWVVGIRLLVFVMSLALIVSILVGVFSTKNDINLSRSSQDIFELVFTTIYSLSFYFLIIKSFRRLKMITQ